MGSDTTNVNRILKRLLETWSKECSDRPFELQASIVTKNEMAVTWGLAIRALRGRVINCIIEMNHAKRWLYYCQCLIGKGEAIAMISTSSFHLSNEAASPFYWSVQPRERLSGDPMSGICCTYLDNGRFKPQVQGCCEIVWTPEAKIYGHRNVGIWSFYEGTHCLTWARSR